MKKESRKSLLSVVSTVAVGLIGGYVAGWIVWWVYGQVQLLLHMDFPYAAMYSPPLLYQIGWAVFGAIVLFLGLAKK